MVKIIEITVFLWNLKLVSLLSFAEIPDFEEPSLVRYDEIALLQVYEPHNRRQYR